MDENNKNYAEELKKREEEHNRKFLLYEFVIIFLCLAAFFVMLFAACYGVVSAIWQATLVISAIILLVVGVLFAVKMEAEVGYYECGKCHHRYVPKYKAVMFSPHFVRTRYMKCPECGERSWNKKRLTK